MLNLILLGLYYLHNKLNKGNKLTTKRITRFSKLYFFNLCYYCKNFSRSLYSERRSNSGKFRQLNQKNGNKSSLAFYTLQYTYCWLEIGFLKSFYLSSNGGNFSTQI